MRKKLTKVDYWIIAHILAENANDIRWGIIEHSDYSVEEISEIVDIIEENYL